MGRGAAVGVNVEYQPTATAAASAVGLSIEYQPTAVIAAGAIGLMVEYTTVPSGLGLFPQERLANPGIQGQQLKRRRGQM
jgi:hypothetical protein